MYDSVGHGTHIAGTIAEATPDNVKILPIDSELSAILQCMNDINNKSAKKLW